MQSLSNLFGSGSLTKDRLKSVGGALAAAVLFGTFVLVSDAEHDSLTEEQKENAQVNYLNQRGCDGDAFKRGEVLYCPE